MTNPISPKDRIKLADEIYESVNRQLQDVQGILMSTTGAIAELQSSIYDLERSMERMKEISNGINATLRDFRQRENEALKNGSARSEEAHSGN